MQNTSDAVIAAKDETIAILKEQLRILEMRIQDLEAANKICRIQLEQLITRVLDEKIR